MDSDQHHKGSLLGGILLVAGCCIGAGMLGLPVLSAAAGFQPSLFIFFVCWIFMACTGLLLLEVNLWFGQEINIITMAERTLGAVGKGVTWFVFLFLFYSLMIAYVAASGSLVADFTARFLGIELRPWMGSLAFCLLFSISLYRGTGSVDWFNRILMAGLVIFYLTLVAMGAKHVNSDYLAHQNWSAVTAVIPAVIVSFGFHNLVPSLTTYLKGNVKSLKLTILIGSAIPLLVYLVWEWIILGIVPPGEFAQALDKGEIATQALENAAGSSWIIDAAQAFAFFAIVTSFLSVALSFVDFLSDGLGIKKTPKGKIILVSCVLIPPFIFAFLYPTIFLMALNYAGGYGAVILFGILPALMVWKGRMMFPEAIRLVPGGKITLTAVILFAIWVMSLQII